ncbi:MAG: hypothetical protein H7Y04_00135 [Verrucomicrobia bacterium]|nr:hypothetical protein [Cytophagales bacterium]
MKPYTKKQKIIIATTSFLIALITSLVTKDLVNFGTALFAGILLGFILSMLFPKKRESSSAS